MKEKLRRGDVIESTLLGYEPATGAQWWQQRVEWSDRVGVVFTKYTPLGSPCGSFETYPNNLIQLREGELSDQIIDSLADLLHYHWSQAIRFAYLGAQHNDEDDFVRVPLAHTKFLAAEADKAYRETSEGRQKICQEFVTRLLAQLPDPIWHATMAEVPQWRPEAEVLLYWLDVVATGTCNLIIRGNFTPEVRQRLYELASFLNGFPPYYTDDDVEVAHAWLVKLAERRNDGKRKVKDLRAEWGVTP